jgi:hypothetical protein
MDDRVDGDGTCQGEGMEDYARPGHAVRIAAMLILIFLLLGSMVFLVLVMHHAGGRQ